MSYIDELRERFLSAEQRFGRINEAGKEYRERLMGLMSRIEEEIRCRRDVEQQQAKEIERLTGENEELRTMLMSLLQAVESGDPNSLDDTLGEMDTKVAGLIGEGQGAPVAASEPDADEDDDSAEADPFEDDSSDDDGDTIPEDFDAGEMMADAADDGAEDESEDGPLGEHTLPENAFADEDDPLAIEEDDGVDFSEEEVTAEASEPEADAEPVSEEAEDGGEATSDAEPAPGQLSASEIADFFGADTPEPGEELPTYAHPVAGWDDFLDDDTPVGETASEPAPEAVEQDDEAGDADAGSIRDLLDRVKTEVGGESDDDTLEDDNNGGTAAAG